MKLIITFLLLFLTTIICFSCKKNAIAKKGDWKWLYSSQGGFAGGIIYPSNGSVVSLSLDNNSTYTLYLNNQITTQGSYAITSSSGISLINFDKMIGADKLVLNKQEGIYQTSDSLFIINSDLEDSPTSVFVKNR